MWMAWLLFIGAPWLGAAPPEAQWALSGRIAEADALVQERRFLEAVAVYQDAIDSDGHNVEALFKQGQAYARLGAFSQALRRWQEVLSLTDDPLIHRSAQENIRKAAAKPADSSPGGPQARGLQESDRTEAQRAYEQGLRLMAEGAHAAALPLLTRTVQLSPQLAAAYIARGSALLSLGRTEEAKQDYRRSQQLEPESAAPLYGLAECERVQGRRLAAADLYERYAASGAADVKPPLREDAAHKARRLRDK